MKVFDTLRFYVANLFGRRRADADMTEELREHVLHRADDLERGGLGREEAVRRARLEFGATDKYAEECREALGTHLLETFSQDVRYALRMLRKAPGFAIVSILTLALGIGANTAIFSVVYAMVLKPLPYADSSKLYNVFQHAPANGGDTGWSYANFEDVNAENTVFSGMAGAQLHQLTLTGHGEPFVVNTSVVTPDFFNVFGVTPLAGRTFLPEDGKHGSTPTVVLSENLWRSAFGAESGIIGKSVELDKNTFTVIGVVPSAFRFPQVNQSEQIWIPLVQDPLFGPWMERRGGHWLQVTGRLKPGVTESQAEAELAALSNRAATAYPADNKDWTARIAPLQRMIVGDTRAGLLTLLAAVGLVLLIACANIANLLLARATSRAKEIALRTTLGAGRARIVRQLLSETAVLSLLGGAAGVALAYAGVRMLAGFLPSSLPQVNAIRVDGFVLGFALALSLLASFAVGLVPAFFMAKENLQAALREGGGRSGESASGRRARALFAAAEISLAMVLLVGAGLLLRSFSKLTATSPGFNAENLVRAEISLPRAQYSEPRQWVNFADQMLARVQAEPGLKQSAFAVPLPLADGFVNIGFDIVGKPPVTSGALRTTDYAAITPNYFQVMEIPLLSGRLFDARDSLDTPVVTLVNKAMVRRYFPNEDPIGKRITFGFPPEPGAPHEIIGVVGDVRDVALDTEPGPMVYVPFAQSPLNGGVLVVRSGLSTASVATTIRSDAAKLDKDLPVTDIGKMTDALSESVAQPRFRTYLLAVFAAMALILAATGIFGVISYAVACRTQEIGIRVALGASRANILQMVLRETLLLAAAGLALGIPCALAASHFAGHLLFGVSASDPLTLFVVAAALIAVAALAAYVPARRAMSTDPAIALRQ